MEGKTCERELSEEQMEELYSLFVLYHAKTRELAQATLALTHALKLLDIPHSSQYKFDWTNRRVSWVTSEESQT